MLPFAVDGGISSARRRDLFFLSETLQAERKLNGLMIKNKIFCLGGGYRDTSSS